jgi:hypothetical protein
MAILIGVMLQSLMLCAKKAPKLFTSLFVLLEKCGHSFAEKQKERRK